jgi:hypothetical protein
VDSDKYSSLEVSVTGWYDKKIKVFDIEKSLTRLGAITKGLE